MSFAVILTVGAGSGVSPAAASTGPQVRVEGTDLPPAQGSLDLTGAGQSAPELYGRGYRASQHREDRHRENQHRGDQHRGDQHREVRDGAKARGPKVTIANDGRAKLLLFVAHWCPLCEPEVREIRRWAARGYPLPGSDRVDYYTISVRENPHAPNWPAARWFAPWSMPVLRDDVHGAAARAYGLISTPMYVLVAADGTLVARHSGRLGIEGIAELLRRFKLIPEPS